MILLKIGDIVLIRSKKNILGKAIYWVMSFFQKDEVNYNHVAIASDITECLEANWKVEITALEDILKDAKHYKILRNEALDFEIRKEIVNKASTKLGNTYGVFRLIFQLFDHIFGKNWFTRLIGEDDYQVCASLVAWAYQEVTGDKINGVDWRSVEPDDFEDESLKDPNWVIVSEK